VRVEDKELEGPELERAQRLEVEELHEQEEELPIASEEVQDVGFEHRGRLFDALQLIMDRQQLNVSLLALPKREAMALEFLQTAVNGRDVNMGEFVFAEDRGAMLEQALAVLQQNLTHGSASELATLHAKFGALTSQVAELRGHLLDLEDAQDDLIEPKEHRVKVVTDEPDDTDKPAAAEPAVAADESLGGFIASALQALAQVAGTDAELLASSLTGPELPPAPVSRSTLTGAERGELPKGASTLLGPDLREDIKPQSTLGGPERPEPPKPATTLVGPEVPDVVKRSTLTTDVAPPPPTSVPIPTRKSSPSIPGAPPATRPSSPSIPVPNIRKSSPSIPIPVIEPPPPPKGKKRG
jgi:hypothetical protein